MTMTIRIKLLIAVSVILLVVAGLISAVHIHTLQQENLKSIQRFSEVLAYTLVDDITETFQSFPNLQTLPEDFSLRCESLRKTHADKAVTHVAVIDDAGFIIAHSQTESVGSPITSLAVLTHLRRRESATILDGEVYHTLVPIVDVHDNVYRGAVDIGVAGDDVLETAFIQTIWVSVLCLIGAAVILLFLFHQMMTQPLRQLANLGKKIAHGEIEHTLSDVVFRRRPQHDARKTRNEIQALTQTFEEVREYVWYMTGVAHKMASGDVQQQVMLFSQDDRLGHALHQMSEYLYEMTTAVAAIAEGNLRQEIAPKGSNDELGQTFVDMVMYLCHIAELGQQIAAGHVDLLPKSGGEGLHAVLHQIAFYLQEAAHVAEEIADNNLGVQVNVRSEDDRLNTAFQRMVTNLQASEERLESSMTQTQQQGWFRTGQAELSDVMRGEQDVNTLAQRIITYLARHIQAQVGAFYVPYEQDGDPVYQLSGAYAYTNGHASEMAFKPGEGLVGQAVESRKPVLISDIPTGHLAVTLGLGQREPRQILIIPCLYENTVLGVVELGTIYEFSKHHQEFLSRVQENIAIAVHTAQSRLKMQSLLVHTQQQSEELLKQQETLRRSNLDLERQAQALHASEERLRVQQEELRQTNEELESQTRTLARQKEELNEKNVDLEHARYMMEEKAQALEQSQSLLKRKMHQLEQAEQYKSEFLANMSHELRTPLNSLLILAKLLSENKEGNLTPKQQEFAHTIHSAGSDLLDLINEVLDLSKVETGKMILNIEQMIIGNLSAYITQNFSHMAKEKGLYLDINVDDDVPTSITTDRQRVEQIIKNLVANALKFTEKGGVRIHISRMAPNVNFADTMLTIAVSDTGIGIPEAKQQIIFEAFQQADVSISGRYGGTGLGLSISREFAKLLGGQILLSSEQDKGSTFTLVVPEHFKSPEEQQAARVEAQLPSEETPSLPETPPMISSASIETIRDDRHDITPDDKTLLIIENDPQFTKQIFDLARERGFKGLVAGDGEAGLQLAFQYRPSAIILNIKLPRMNGWAVTEKLRKNPETRHVPIHFTSGEGENHASMPGRAVGYMTRPVTDDELEDALLLIESTMTFSLKKLLVVAENQATRERLLESLQGNELEISTVTAAQEAYALVKREVFDCVIVDVGMRNMSGLELIELLHQDALVSYLPIVTYRERELTPEEQHRLQSILQRTLASSSSLHEHVADEIERVFDEITLFLHQVEAELPEARQKKVRMLHDRETVFRGKTILLVDDDMRNLYALTSTLEDHRMSVLMAVNGKEALSVLNEHAHDIHLVMMDMMMPEMDGYEAIRAIRQQPGFSRLPIIALTARAMRGDRQKCIEAGANDYLSKPVDVDKLLSLLRVWLY